MTESQVASSSDLHDARRLPALIMLFVGSGCAALIYEIVWFQMLQLVVGSTAVSLAVLLGTFMGGMCLGSLALPRLIGARRHPLRVYATLELGIGIIGVAALYAMPSIGRVYSENVGHGFSGILLRGAVAVVCLLPPTILMGATLPAVARWVETTPRGVAWLGFFYGGNIAGAVFGCLLAGFYLLRVYDVAVATYVAASLNAVVAALALSLSFCFKYRPASDGGAQGAAVRAPGAWRAYAVIMVSGMCALSAEVVWTRLLSLLLGATVYTFSIILAVFLLGLGLGSSVGAYLSRSLKNPRWALGVCQLLLAAMVAWAAYVMMVSLPFWPVDPEYCTDPWLYLQLDVVRCMWALLPAAVLWGASFPLALASAAAPGQDPGRLVGGVYAANTVGAIFGSVGTSLILIPQIGAQAVQQSLIALAALAGFLMLAPRLWPLRVKNLAGAAAAAAIVAFLALPLVLSVAPIPGLMVAYGRYTPTWVGQAKMLYVGEGMNSAVAVSKTNSGTRSFHVSGKVEASNDPQDMRLQRMLGHISALAHNDPKSVLVVGCGAGVTAGSFITYPGIERVVICEIEPLIPKVVAKFFDKENHGVASGEDPRVEIVSDDGRHYILTTQDKFDVITSDPIHPWVKGSATLYTKEYFEMVKEHLNPGGVVTQWVPLYESSPATVKSEIATFFEVFPDGTLWSNDNAGKGYDTVLLGQAGPTKIDVDGAERRLLGPDGADAAQSMRDVGFDGATSLFATYGGRARELKPWLEGAEINRDRNLRLQYIAGLGLNFYESESIYDAIVSYRTYPEDLFTASSGSEQQLRDKIAGGYGDYEDE